MKIVVRLENEKFNEIKLLCEALDEKIDEYLVREIKDAVFRLSQRYLQKTIARTGLDVDVSVEE